MSVVRFESISHTLAVLTYCGFWQLNYILSTVRLAFWQLRGCFYRWRVLQGVHMVKFQGYPALLHRISAWRHFHARYAFAYPCFFGALFKPWYTVILSLCRITGCA